MDRDGRIRVFHFADTINRFDFIDNVVRHLDCDVFSTGVVTFGREANIASPRFTESGIPQFVLDVSRKTDLARAVRELATVLRREQVDVLHTHHYFPGAIGAAAVQLAGTTRLVIGRHYSEEIHLLPGIIRRTFFLQIESAINRLADRIVVPSAMIRDMLIDRQGVPADKVDLVPYAFDPVKYRLPSVGRIACLSRELGIDRQEQIPVLIGTVGRLNSGKGHRYLFEALRKLHDRDPHSDRVPRLHCLVVGDGPDRAQLQSLSKSLGIADLITFTGWRTDAIDLIALCDMVVQPTLYEAFSQTMIEAMWLGKPLVMTRVSGAPDIITDNLNGILVPPKDSLSLASAIEQLAVDKDLRVTLGTRARSTVQERLSIDAILPSYERVYLKSLGLAARVRRDSDSVAPVSLVIPVRNETRALPGLFTAIRSQTLHPDEVIIVDGGSTDGTYQHAVDLASSDSRYRVVDAGPASPGRGRNIGIEHARNPWIAMTDAGCIPRPRWLEALRTAATANPKITVVAGSYEPIASGVWASYIWPLIAPPTHNTPNGWIRGPSVASMLVSRSAWRAAGRFPDLRAAEDLLFFERLTASGANWSFAPEAVVEWEAPQSLLAHFRRTRLYSRINVEAGLQGRWHYGVVRQYAFGLMMGSVALLVDGWIIWLIPIAFVARVVKALARHRRDMGLIWTLDPRRLFGTALALLVTDAGTFAGWIDHLRSN